MRLLIFSLLLLTANSLIGSQWYTEYAKARCVSEKENKPVLIFFNGSDWSGHAMKMKHEVLDGATFQKKIGPHFIFLEADFPQHTTLSQQIIIQNSELRERFSVQEIPSLVLIDSQERVIARLGYLPESEEQLANDLITIIEQDLQLVRGLQNLDARPDHLRKLYHIAQELGRTSAMEEILTAGLNTEDSYFFLEKYRMLVERGEMRSENALFLRQKLNLLDIENRQEALFTLALIDFQELSQKKEPPEVAVQPLTDYLLQFGKSDQKNVWRIEMMIAQLYLDAEVREEALRHAEKALLAAPKDMYEEIAHSLNYIRSMGEIK